MATERKHYVEFFSFGTLVAEQSSREIELVDALDARKIACEMAQEIVERYGARPFGFQFVIRIVSDPISDGEGGELAVQPKEVARSGMHYLGGALMLFRDVPDNQDHHILRSNMRGNRMPVIIVNTNSFRFTGGFGEDDVIVDDAGEITYRGNDPDLMTYRAEFEKEREAYYAGAK